MTEHYQMGLLYLVHLLVSSDGFVDENELEALKQLKAREKIQEKLFEEFEEAVKTKREREIYEDGLKYLSQCSKEERMRAFVILYKMSEVDGWIHVKEVRLLLYSIRVAGIDFEDVVKEAESIPSFK